jgi:hypothetical protein
VLVFPRLEYCLSQIGRVTKHGAGYLCLIGQLKLNVPVARFGGSPDQVNKCDCSTVLTRLSLLFFR